MKILSAEFFKLRKGKMLPVLFIIAVGFAALYAAMTVLSVEYMFDMLREQGIDLDDEIMAGIGFRELFPDGGLLALSSSFMIFQQVVVISGAVMAAIFICDEFDSGTVRNLLSIGRSRVKYYAVKLGIVFVTAILLAAVSTAINTGVITAFYGFGATGDGFALDLFLFIVGQVLTYATYISLFVMFAFLFRSVGAAMGVSIGCVFILEQLIFLILDMDFAASVSFLRNGIPFYNMMQFTAVFNGNAGMGDFAIAAIICVVTAIIATAVGIVTFSKRDVK